MLAAKNQSHTLLFTLDNPLPPELAGPHSSHTQEARREAQASFADFIKKTGRTTPLLVARFVARQIAIETQKLATASLRAEKKAVLNVEIDFTDAEGTADAYTLSDHIERLRYLEIQRNEEEEKLLIGVLKHALPGLEDFMTAQRHAMISGKMAYNAFGVCYGGGRDDKVRDFNSSIPKLPMTPFKSPSQVIDPKTSNEPGRLMELADKLAAHSTHCHPTLPIRASHLPDRPSALALLKFP